MSFSEQKVAKQVPTVSEVLPFDTFWSQEGSTFRTVSAHAMYLAVTLRRMWLTIHVTDVDVKRLHQKLLQRSKCALLSSSALDHRDRTASVC